MSSGSHGVEAKGTVHSATRTHRGRVEQAPEELPRCHAFNCACFFFNDTATDEIYTLSLHDALPIWTEDRSAGDHRLGYHGRPRPVPEDSRSEEHTSELQSPCNLLCRLLLAKTQDNDRGQHLAVLATARRLRRGPRRPC